MARLVVCDVCETEQDPDSWVGVSMEIPGHMVMQPDAAVYDICSWECIQKLVDTYRPADGQTEERVVSTPTYAGQMTTEDDGLQIVNEPKHVAEPEWEIPPTGVYMPEGIRVDGKPAESLPKPKLRVKTD